MAKKYSDIVTEARQLLQDTLSPYRYSDEILVNTLNRGLQTMARIRPDAFYDEFDTVTLDVTVPEITEANMATTDFDLPMQFYSPLIYFVVAWAEVIDDEFTNDGRASALLSAFKAELIGV